VTAPITNNASVTTASGNSVSVTGAATNNGTWSVSGGSTLNQSGGFTNNSGGTLSVTDSTATFGGGAAANNAGATIQVIGSAITFAGGLTNNGAYISDPSTNTFTSLTIGSTGYISASAGDSYVITGPGGFVNNSTDTAHWTTMGATLEYAGTGSQTLGLNASNGDGLNNIFDNSFGWKTLALDSGSFVNLVGGSVISDNAFYVDSLTGLTFSGLDVTNVEGNGYDIFYLASADPTLDGLTYDLADGGFLIPIGAVVPPQNAPEPGALTLLASALAGLGWFRRRLPGSKL
jgi:fibronectin-binding autotransporter adhesin